ncbi:MAG: tripartite tricarboxylate transporter permease [Thermodesulfobacteriota bacterium]
MDVLHNLALGFSVFFTWSNLGYCFLGTLIGTLIGVLPGIGPAATMSLLLPATYYLSPISGIIMMAGVLYGAMYGGSSTSILVNIPGESSSIVTCLDGHQMALQGRAGAALGIAAFGSFIAGTLAIVGLMIGTTLLSHVALQFGPPEYFSLIFLSFSLLIYLSSGSTLKAVMMAAAGVFVGTVGTDFITGDPRFTYGSLTLSDGIGLVPVVMGTFGIAEVLENLEAGAKQTTVIQPRFRKLLPTLQDWKESIGPILRGSVIGFFLGMLPGGGAIVASFASYAVEKRITRHPERFGKGAIEGVAGPEAANNSAVISHFVPLVSLGLPANVVMALILGALMVHGLRPGPTFIQDNPQLFWGVVASMYAGNAMLLVLNLPLIGVWVRLLSVPYRVLFPLILLFCSIGVYSVNNNFWELIIMVIFGFFGYLVRKFKYEVAPFAFAFVLSSIMENALRQSLLMSRGSFRIFFGRPIACVLMIAGCMIFLLPLLPFFKRQIFSDKF